MAADHNPISKLHTQFAEQNNAQMERQKRKKQRLMRRLVLLSVFVAILIGTFTTFHLKQRHLQAEKRTELAEMKKEYAAVQKKGKELKQERDLLKDEDYVLEIARTNYFFSKKGELIFKIPDEKPSY
ncbi:septum formation initiator family protein [Aciduricibacillus chroicocephali]|uniref:Septum formation initiator family protein n=1 Tax=Aciduricibacillus chroicocephali TaxID=3054939 RepID=A0ABY9KWQ9_9BACI|nr:septum formation initiator family protein [Bacillaceae bacterium 44XB]